MIRYDVDEEYYINDDKPYYSVNEKGRELCKCDSESDAKLICETLNYANDIAGLFNDHHKNKLQE